MLLIYSFATYFKKINKFSPEVMIKKTTGFGKHIWLNNILIDFLSEEQSHLQGGSPIFYPHSLSSFSACRAKLGLWGMALSHFPQKVTASWRTKLQLLLSIYTGYSFPSLALLSTNAKF